MRQLTFEVHSEDRGERLDLYLMSVLEDHDLTRSFIQRLIKDQKIRVNGGSQKASYRLKDNDRLDIELPEPDRGPIVLKPEPIALNILYEDEAIIVLNKAMGMTVHPGAGCCEGTLVNALLHHTRLLSSINGPLRPGIVHRLDRTTSGVMVVARNDRDHVRLARQFQKKVAHKEYLAIIHDHIVPTVGTIDAPIGRDRHNRVKMAVVQNGGREAVTGYNLEERFAHFDLVRLTPLHGRTHQLRVHLASVGHPVLGDTLYGKNIAQRVATPELTALVENLKSHNGNALHAQRLSFNHPETGAALTFEAALPEQFRLLMDLLRQSTASA
ncbi:RluA family pseudouridine synthase [bacterium]|nr:RluA family pseudouridine synthase [bacterium]